MRLPPKHQRDVLKIGELAEELGTTPRTIRLYEELGLIAPDRTEGVMPAKISNAWLSRCSLAVSASNWNRFKSSLKPGNNVLPAKFA